MRNKKGTTPPHASNVTSPVAGLSPEDQAHLAELHKRLQLVSDRTVSVARGYSTGLFLHGEGGIGLRRVGEAGQSGTVPSRPLRR